jgi:RNA polymerase sigma factor (TIGR02999 family)
MRRILIDDARRRLRTKRGGNAVQVPVEGIAVAAPEPDTDPVDVIGVDRALQSLEQVDQDQAKLVELRFFGGLTVEEAAAVLGVSPTTVKREWAVAKAWLYRALTTGNTSAQ